MKTFMENFKIARIQTKKALKREGFMKYYLYYFMRIIFSFGILLSSFLVSKWKLASEIKEENNISITGLFEPVSGKGYFHLLVSNLIKAAIFLGVLLFIILIGGLLFLIGFGIAYLGITQKNPNINFLIPILFTIPAAILLIALIIAIPFINVPNSYVVNNYPQLTPGRILKYSFYSMKNGGKILMLKTLLFEYVTKILFLGIAIGLPILLSYLIRGYIGFGIQIILMAILLLVFLYIDPIISLIALLIKSNIYDEVVFIKNSNKINEININNDDIIINNSNQETLNSLFKIEKKIDLKPSYENSLEENKKNYNDHKVQNRILESLKEEPQVDVDLVETEEILEENEKIVLNDEKIETKETEETFDIQNSHKESKDIELNKDINDKEKEDYQKVDDLEEIILEEIDSQNQAEEVTPQEEIKEENIIQESVEELEEIKEEAQPELEEIKEDISKEDEQEETSEVLEQEIQEEPEELEEIKEEPQTDVETKEEKTEDIQNEVQEEIILEEIEPENEKSDVEEYLNNIPEKTSEDDEFNAFLDSIPEKKETKRGRKKKGE